MKNKLRILAALLTVATSLGLIACASDSGTSNDTSADTASTETTAAVETERTSGLPDKDWGGRTITFAARDSSYGDWETFEIYTDVETGEPINDAVFARNSAVEERYNLKVAENKMKKEMAPEIQKYIQAGDNVFDAIIASGRDTTTLANTKLLLDLYSVENLNIENEWWDQNANRDFAVGDKCFMTVGDLMISDKDGSWVYTFNKKMIEDFNLESPYDLVRNNEWTYDKFRDVAKVATADLDGDGTLTGEVDQYGIATETYDIFAAFFYSGARIFDNVSGYPELVFNNERSITAYMDYFDIINDADVYYGNADNSIKTKMFKEGRSLFRGTTMNAIRFMYRDIEHDFGIVVAPKYEESQDSYHHIVSIGGSASTFSIPITTPDPAFTGFAVEALCFASTDTLLHEYLNTAFNGKYLRDEDSVEMLQLCIDTRVYDLSVIQSGWGNWVSHMMAFKQGETPDLVSYYASVEASINAQIEEVYGQFK